MANVALGIQQAQEAVTLPTITVADYSRLMAKL